MSGDLTGYIGTCNMVIIYIYILYRHTVLVGIEFGFGTHYYENNRRLIAC